MQNSKTHTTLVLYLMQHALSELIPFARCTDRYADDYTFTIRFTAKHPIDDSFVPHLMNRCRELAKALDVKEMIEGNARDYLFAQGEHSLGNKLSRGGKRLVSLLSIFGQHHLVFEEVASEPWPFDLLYFQEERGVWRLTGCSLPTDKAVATFAATYKALGDNRFDRRGEALNYFSYHSRGTVWNEAGLLAVESLLAFLRTIYNEEGIVQKRYPGKPEKEPNVFSIGEVRDSLFPATPCIGDTCYFAWDPAKSERLLGTIQQYFNESGCRTEVREKKNLYIYDLFGTQHRIASVKKEMWKEGTFSCLSLLTSLEKGVALLIERK